MTVSTATTGPRRAGPRSTRAGLGVVVPGDWWLLPLDDEDGTRRQITAMVSHRFGRDDAAAGLRREVRVSVTAAARRATASGGWLMGYMLTRVGDVPLPATLTAYRLSGTLATSADVDALRVSLGEYAASAGGSVDVGEGPFGPVLRGIRERHGTVPGSPEIPVLICDYWTDPRDGDGLVNLSFSTPVLALREGFVELFDAVAGTLYRFEDDGGDDEDADDDNDHEDADRRQNGTDDD